MSLAAIIDALFEAGATREMIVAAVRAHESSSPTVQARSKGAIRQARYEENKRQKASEIVTPDANDVSDENTRPLPSSPQTPQLPTPTRENNSTRVRATKRVPAEWSPSPADLAVAEGVGLSVGEIERQLATMRDHEFKTARTDWGAAFRNWVRRAAPTSSAKPKGLFDDRPASRQTSRDDRLDRMLAGAMDAVDR